MLGNVSHRMRTRPGHWTELASAAIAIILLTSTSTNPVKAQTDQSAPSTPSSTSDAKDQKEPASAVNEVASQSLSVATELDEKAQALREYLKKMRTHLINYHLSDGPGESKPLLREWVKMLDRGRVVHQEMVEAALREYQKKPEPDSKNAEFLFEVAARNADADRFDGMFEVVKTLKESGFTATTFDLCFGLTAAAANEFELAKPHLESARAIIEKAMHELRENPKVSDEEREATGKKMFEVFNLLADLSDVDQLRPLWEAELKLREADAAGEPLPRVLIVTTKGEIEVELFENQVPNTVANFISLCEQGFYDGLPFHRVLTHFMAQGGCPNRDGTGGPGYSIPTELSEETQRNFFRGTLGMALSGAPDSGGSQFYICYLPRTYLNGKYVAFGRVVRGMNVVSDFTHIDPEDKENLPRDLPDEIISTKILHKRDHAYKPTTIPAAR